MIFIGSLQDLRVDQPRKIVENKVERYPKKPRREIDCDGESELEKERRLWKCNYLRIPQVECRTTLKTPINYLLNRAIV